MVRGDEVFCIDDEGSGTLPLLRSLSKKIEQAEDGGSREEGSSEEAGRSHSVDQRRGGAVLRGHVDPDAVDGRVSEGIYASDFFFIVEISVRPWGFHFVGTQPDIPQKARSRLGANHGQEKVELEVPPRSRQRISPPGSALYPFRSTRSNASASAVVRFSANKAALGFG